MMEDETDLATMTGREPLATLLAEVDAADEQAFTPEDEVKPYETVVCEVPPWLRKVYALMRFYGREAALLKAQIPFARKDTEREPLSDSWRKADDNEDVLSEIFWTSCRRVLEQQPIKVDAMGIRKDWKLVTFEVKDSNPLAGLFGKI